MRLRPPVLSPSSVTSSIRPTRLAYRSARMMSSTKPEVCISSQEDRATATLMKSGHAVFEIRVRTETDTQTYRQTDRHADQQRSWREVLRQYIQTRHAQTSLICIQYIALPLTRSNTRACWCFLAVRYNNQPQCYQRLSARHAMAETHVKKCTVDADWEHSEVCIPRS